MSDKVTAFKEIVRQRLSNGVTNDSVSQTGTIKMWTGSAWRNLLETEGSVTDGLSPRRRIPTGRRCRSAITTAVSAITPPARGMKLP
jgi:hypothetical protein